MQEVSEASGSKVRPALKHRAGAQRSRFVSRRFVYVLVCVITLSFFTFYLFQIPAHSFDDQEERAGVRDEGEGG